MLRRWQSTRLLPLALFLCSGLVGGAAAQEPPGSDNLIGSWTLVSAQRTGGLLEAREESSRASGPPGRTRGGPRSSNRGSFGQRGGGGPGRFGPPSSRGLLVLDGAGNVFEFFSNERRGTGNTPPSDIDTYGGFWGRYRIDHEAQHMIFEVRDGVSPNVSSQTFTRRFRLDGDTLVLTSTDEPDAQANMRWTWQRNPVVENLSPAYRDVVGFWQHIEEGRMDPDTGILDEPRHRAPSVIVYTPSGYVGVHFPPEGRETDAQIAAAADTEPGDEDDEDQSRLGGYIGYFGTLNVYPGEVSHNILSGVSPGTGSILRRYAEIEGDELIVTLQSTGTGRSNDDSDEDEDQNEDEDDDESRGVTIVKLKRISGAEHMLPPEG